MMEMLIFYCFYKHFLRIPAKKSGRPPAGRSAYSQSEKSKSNQKGLVFQKVFSPIKTFEAHIWYLNIFQSKKFKSNQKSLSPIKKV